MSEGDSHGETAPADSPGGGPRKLHVLTIPYRLVQQGAGIVVFLFFIGVPGLTGALGTEGGLLGLVGVVVVAGAFVGYFVAYYQRYEYELTADTFDIRSGVFSRREREIPLRRIQNVDISQSVTQRVFGLASVGLETAGGGQTEAQLQYVGEEEASRLQSEVSRLRRAGDATADVDEEAAQPPAETIFEISRRELGVLALVSTDFRVVSLVFFAGSVFGPSAFEQARPVFAGPETVLGWLFGPLAAIASIIVIGIVAGLVSAARYYGFRLTRGEAELRYERGLLQKYSGTIPLSKVQTLSVKETVLARRLGYAALYIETAGSVASSGDSGGSQSAVPLAERDRVRALARSIEDVPLDSFERPPKRARQRYAARYSLVVLALTGLLYVSSTLAGVETFWYAPLALLVVVPVGAHLKWRHRGYYLGDDHVVTRNGFWSRTTKIVPYHRVQTTVSTETVFQRRRRLGTVVVDTAGSRSITGHDPKAVDVDVGTAYDLRETVADRLYEALRSSEYERSLDRIRVDPTERFDPGGRSEPTGD
ncbi:MAG: PH domain-containing protein [Haloarculaceae archaeon]